MFILPSSALIDREAYLLSGSLDERLSGYEDDDLFTRMFAKGYRGHYVNKSLTNWRLHSGSASFSKRMAVSRMIYYRKLVEMFPDEPMIEMNWVRDIIAPRFFFASLHDFRLASRMGDIERMDVNWADILEVSERMKPRLKRRIRRLSTIMPSLYRNGMVSLARRLMRSFG